MPEDIKPDDIFKLHTIDDKNLMKAFQLSKEQWEASKAIIEQAFRKYDSHSEAIKFIYNSEHIGLNARVLAIFQYGRFVEEFNTTMEEGMMMRTMKKKFNDAMQEDE